MNNVNTLKMSLYQNEWFALINVNMRPDIFSGIINSLERVFVKEYGPQGARQHVQKVVVKNRPFLLINQKKVPNIIKSFVHNPNIPIQVYLKGKLNTGEEAARMIKKPFEVGKCIELIPYYNKGVQKQPNKQAR
jgi:hypothetical protein